MQGFSLAPSYLNAPKKDGAFRLGGLGALARRAHLQILALPAGARKTVPS